MGKAKVQNAIIADFGDSVEVDITMNKSDPTTMLIDKADWDWLKDFGSRVYYTIKGRNKYALVCKRTKPYYVHLLIKRNKAGVVDHIDHNSLNNCRDNMRSVSQTENSRNCKMSKNNKSGFNGVRKNRQGKWQARIKVGRVEHHLGTFTDIADAIAARKKANAKFGFHPNHGQPA